LDEAIAEYRAAVRIDKDAADVHCNLGHVLQDQGKFEQALAAFRRGHESGSKNPHWRYPSAEWVRHCERLIELDGKLPALLRGEITAANAEEQLEFGELSYRKGLYGATARLLGNALAAQPALADDLTAAHRYNAACAAAQAGCGRGKDAGGLPDKDYVRLRTQALKWLRDDLAAWRTVLGQPGDKARPAVAKTLRHWLEDSDFNGVRGPDALARLPEDEREGWQKVWADVAATLAQAQGKTAPK
jgi:tetratricopeptide (TPR) repeat protein